MEWAIEAIEEVGITPPDKVLVSYSGRFKGYNANIRCGKGFAEFRLSHEWKRVDEEIKKGIIQHLICKAYKIHKRTYNQELYEEFLRQAANYAPRIISDDLLVERYNKLNDEYFSGLLDQPNIIWGRHSLRKLGSYDYGTDTIKVSTVLKENTDLLDYVLYHEMLHKKHKFTCKNGRSHHHTKEFREDEKKFRLEDAEKNCMST